MSISHRTGIRRGLVALCTALAMSVGFGVASSAHAGLILNIESDSANSTNQLGTFTGTIDYGFDIGLNSWTVLITLTNTSNPANAGRLTGFLFNINSTDANASAALHSADYPFQNAAGQSGNPLGGTYDAGAALGGNWNGGGPPAPGIAPGATGSFLFKVSASDANSLSAMSFITGPETYNFVVRFRGFNGGGSDKVPAVESVVPGPSALCALAIGLVLSRGRQRAV
jgi:hypothetical protein